jgi:hypothetical protein
MTGPAHYRKIPVEIEAMRIDGDSAECRKAALEFAGAVLTWEEVGSGRKIMIETLEGALEILPGYWLVKGVAGEFYPVRDDIFTATYEPLEYAATGPDEGADS